MSIFICGQSCKLVVCSCPCFVRVFSSCFFLYLDYFLYLYSFLFIKFIRYILQPSSPVSRPCRKHWLDLCRGISPLSSECSGYDTKPSEDGALWSTPSLPLLRRSTQECPGYEIKQSDSKAPVILELWGIQNTSSLPLLPGPLWLGMVAPDSPIY